MIDHRGFDYVNGGYQGHHQPQRYRNHPVPNPHGYNRPPPRGCSCSPCCVCWIITGAVVAVAASITIIVISIRCNRGGHVAEQTADLSKCGHTVTNQNRGGKWVPADFAMLTRDPAECLANNAVIAGSQAGLMYKLTKNGITHYMIGTIHSEQVYYTDHLSSKLKKFVERNGIKTIIPEQNPEHLRPGGVDTCKNGGHTCPDLIELAKTAGASASWGNCEWRTYYGTEGRIYYDFKGRVSWKGLETKPEVLEAVAEMNNLGGDFTENLLSPPGISIFGYGRNKKWMNGALKYLDQATTPSLILPGVLHLWGKEGLPKLFKDAGWQVEFLSLKNSP